jgi:hypothetical protein
VVAVGPGKKDEEMNLAPGDKVVYFKYAGDKMTVRAPPPHPRAASHAGAMRMPGAARARNPLPRPLPAAALGAHLGLR